MTRVWGIGVALLVMTAGASGCLEWPFQGENHDRAYWFEPGLSDALVDNPPADPHATNAPLPAGAAPWDHWSSPYLLTRVQMTHPEMAHGIILSTFLDEDNDPPVGGMQLHFSSFRGTPEETLREALIHFINETGIEPERQEKIVEQAMESWADSFKTEEPRTFAGARIVVENVTGLDALIDRLNATRAQRTSLDQNMPAVGAESMVWDRDDNTTWRFSYRLGVHTLRVGDHKGESQTLKVDTGNKVRITLPRAIGDDEARHQEWIREGFEARGLPPPTFDRFHISTLT